MKKLAQVLTIAGSDSGGGAGIQADLKTMSAWGCYGLTVLTAVTAQNTLGVSHIEALSQQSVAAQITAVMTDFDVNTIKIGMLASPELVQTVANSLRDYPRVQIVLDPVLVATSGAVLGSAQTAQRLQQDLFPRARLITPNLSETAVLLGRPIHTVEQMEEAARELVDLGVHAALIKGGHLEDTDLLVDVLAIKTGQSILMRRYAHAKISTENTHGTGCTLSSAIACGLALGAPLEEAVAQAIDYVQEAIRHAVSLNLGQGPGPLWHAFRNFPLIH